MGVAQTIGITSAPKMVTLANNQSVPLNAVNICASGDYAVVPGGPNPCRSTVAVNSTCTLPVMFTPTKIGIIKAVATLTDDATISP